MPAWRCVHWFAYGVVLLALGTGCSLVPAPRDVRAASTPPASTSQRSPLLARLWDGPGNRNLEDANDLVLRNGAEVQWSIQSARAPANRSMAGHAIVGPDGTIELGPYGTVHVAGLTVRQARTAAMNHVSTYLSGPQVVLAVEPAS
jgi:protein involved in polysaccharide export with SLBB domain